MFRSDADGNPFAAFMRAPARQGQLDIGIAVKRHLGAGACLAGDPPFKEIHLRRSDEAADEHVVRIGIEGLRRADLFDQAVPQDDDLVRKGHRLDLVMRHIDHRRAEILMKLGDLEPHLDAQLGIEVREWLVEQEDLRFAHDRTSDGDALALAAGQRLGLAFQKVVKAENVGSLAHTAVDFCGAGAVHFQAEGHIVIDRHMGIKRVGLEHHGHAAI